MEDRFLAAVNFDENCSVFGVFDGHGGSEVAEFCKNNFVRVLKENIDYKGKNYESAL